MRGSIPATIILLASAGAGHSQVLMEPCSPRTDREVHQPPALPELPSAGGVFRDPTFCTSILRVTDERDGRYFQTAYSYWPTFNRDSSRIYLLQDDDGLRAWTYEFDARRFRVSGKGAVLDAPAPNGESPRTEDAIWSGTDPEVLYCHAGPGLWAYDVTTRAYALVRDFSAEIGDGHLRQMSRSVDDGVFAFTTLNRRFRVTGSLVWRRSDNRVIVRPDEPEGLDEVQIDKSGRYLVIKTGGAGDGAIQVRVLDVETGAVAELTDGPPDYAPGHGDCGFGTIIGYDNWLNRLRSRRLSDPHSRKTVFNLGDDWTQDIHVSLLGDDPAWMLLSLYTQSADCDVPAGLFRDEILLMRTDGSEEVRRLAHHRSCVGEYWDSPRANLSRDGRFAAFTSNWGGADRRDVFILRTGGDVPAQSLRRVGP
ncbi:MAG: hypothetical protein BroJett003_10620 [Planctomycetota bacterium]|nr:MAG: hypothetical protein BroJett003_10620 [Planctomycetota bacterium]